MKILIFFYHFLVRSYRGENKYKYLSGQIYGFVELFGRRKYFQSGNQHIGQHEENHGKVSSFRNATMQ